MNPATLPSRAVGPGSATFAPEADPALALPPPPTRRALVVGINRYGLAGAGEGIGGRGDLRGAENDARRLHELLLGRFGADNLEQWLAARQAGGLGGMMKSLRRRLKAFGGKAKPQDDLSVLLLALAGAGGRGGGA